MWAMMGTGGSASGAGMGAVGNRIRTLACALALGLVAPPLLAAPASAATPSGVMLVVLSGSTSMRDNLGQISKAATARRGITTFVDGLPADGQVALRTYGTTKTTADGDACQDSKRTVDLGTNNRARLLAGLTDYFTSGAAAMGYALQQGADDLKAQPTATIVLVSDGSNTCTPDPCDTAAQLVAANPHLTIDVVGVGADGDAEKTLKCVAEKGLGSYLRAASMLDVADAMEQFAQQSVRPADVTPVSVSGGGDGTTAAELATGDYIDKLGPIGSDGAVRYYAVQRTIDSSDIGVAASILPAHGVDDGVKIEITQSGKACETSSASTVSTFESVVATLAVVGVGHTSYPECAAAKRLLVKIERQSSGKRTASTDIPVTIRVTEHEPVADQALLPTTLDIPRNASTLAAGNPVSTKPGSTLATGARLSGAGSTYAGTIAPGELQTFRVNATWGQNLGAKAIVLEPKPSVKTELDQRDKALTIRIISPLGATSAYNYTSSLTSGGDTYVDTDPVVYRGQDDQMQAGDYTVVVGLIVDGEPAGIAVPYQLVVQTTGAETGMPVYGTPGSITATTKASTSATSSPPPPPASPRVSLTTRLWIGLAGALLLGAGIGAYVPLRRIRSRTVRS